MLLSKPKLLPPAGVAPTWWEEAFFPGLAPIMDLTTYWALAAFVDFNLRGHLGAEGEVRFLRFNQTYSVHEDNYDIGPTVSLADPPLGALWEIHDWQRPVQLSVQLSGMAATF